MTNHNFFYWLQGRIELSDSFEIDKVMAQKIINHCNLIETFSETILQIKTICELIIKELISDLSLASKEIQKLVSDQFEHVIDPLAGPKEVQEELNKKHNLGMGQKPLIRC